ncbi:hypothetical protein BET10_17155 [Pseudoalteromonas amylolytica]|uniref:Uncharacterized protein n=1 Tax=Pseudoalteromonas amylolytica TaxID=1859457 RepID=A0A1S1MSL0_9GAMM|nr:hypothetical protein BFC16_15160 [Pseudoalteromonas sp. JW3]OHU89839.1 hypothetical protein BET10_17155 [Pseudoalteromonas amylolytica]
MESKTKQNKTKQNKTKQKINIKTKKLTNECIPFDNNIHKLIELCQCAFHCKRFSSSQLHHKSVYLET